MWYEGSAGCLSGRGPLALITLLPLLLIWWLQAHDGRKHFPDLL